MRLVHVTNAVLVKYWLAVQMALGEAAVVAQTKTALAEEGDLYWVV